MTHAKCNNNSALNQPRFFYFIPQIGYLFPYSKHNYSVTEYKYKYFAFK